MSQGLGSDSADLDKSLIDLISHSSDTEQFQLHLICSCSYQDARAWDVFDIQKTLDTNPRPGVLSIRQLQGFKSIFLFFFLQLCICWRWGNSLSVLIHFNSPASMKAKAKFTGYRSNCLTSEEHGRRAQIERGSQKEKPGDTRFSQGWCTAKKLLKFPK